MVKIRCQDCGRTAEVKPNWDTSATCSKCDGYPFEIYGSPEDHYDENKQQEDVDKFICERCAKECITNIQKHSDGCCDECGDEPLCDSCLVMLEEVNICKKCIDKAYPRKQKEKIVENILIKYIDKETGKELKPNKIKQDKILDSVL